MATAAEIRARSHVEICYLLAIDGIPTMWTTEAIIAGSGSGTWIGTEGGREVKYGLIVPESITYGISDGLLETSGAEFEIVDHDGTVAQLFGKAEPDAVSYTETRLPASSSAAPSTLYGYGDNIPIHGTQVGIEAIGPSGERRYYPAFRNADLPGLHHAAASDQFSGSLVPVPITDDPWILEGRKVVLYRLYRDPFGVYSTYAEWKTFEWQTTNVPPAFVGTLRVFGRVEGKVWSIKCDGPESYIRKMIGRNAPADWIVARPVYELSTSQGKREDLIGAWFLKTETYNNTTTVCDGASIFDPAYAITDTDPYDIRAYIHTFLNAVATDGVGSYQSTSPYGHVAYNGQGIGIQIEKDNSTWSRGVLAFVCHWKVWRRLGWDPIYQNKTLNNQQSKYDVEYIDISGGGSIDVDGVSYQVPGSGYYIGVFSTQKLGDAGGNSAEKASNDGNWRYYLPTTPLGMQVVNKAGEQLLDLGYDPIYMEGQIGRGPAEYEINGDTCNATRWFLMRSKYRGAADEDVRERYQVFKGSWVSTDGVMDPDGDGLRMLYLERFEDPKLWGIDDDLLDKDWAMAIDPEGSFFIRPLNALRYSPYGVLDCAHHALLRLLLSTGTASISGYEDGPPPVLTAGDNDHPDAKSPHAFATDSEIADLGLGIPHSLVNWKSFIQAASILPGGWKGPLATGIYAWSGQVQAADLIKEICDGHGWELGFAGGKFTLYPKYSTADVNNYVGHLGSSSWHVDPARPGMQPGVQIRATEPVDRWVLHTGRSPVDGEYQREREIRSLDEGAPYRQGRKQVDIQAWGTLPPEWSGDNSLIQDALTWWGQQASRWRAMPSLIITVPVQRRVGQDIYPGDIVTVTTPWAPDMDGGYGLTTRVARVVKARHYFDSGHVVLDLRIEGTPNSNRRFAPVARVLDDVTTVEERYDSATYTFFCYADAWGHGDEDTWSDVTWFDEPAWSELGGSMLVYGWQYNGRRWTRNFSFSVASVDTANHTITATGAITGTFYERMYTILVPAPYSLQTADWVRTLFSVITTSNGKFDGATQGWKLLP